MLATVTNPPAVGNNTTAKRANQLTFQLVVLNAVKCRFEVKAVGTLRGKAFFRRGLSVRYCIAWAGGRDPRTYPL